MKKVDGGWEGELTLFGRRVRVRVDAKTATTRDTRVAAMQARLGATLETGIAEMVKLYEDSWNDGRSVARALKKVVLQRVHVDARGGFEVTLTDGGLFGGHLVTLHTEKSGRVTLALAG